MKLEVASMRKVPGETCFYEFKEEIPSFEFDGSQISLTEPALVKLHITNNGISLVAKAEITGTLQLNCSRCLEPFQQGLETVFEEHYRHISEIGNEEDGDLNYQVYEEDAIDLTDAIKESIILALPMKPVCTTGCQGICPKCGVNKNKMACVCREEELDPRFAALKDYFKRS